MMLRHLFLGFRISLLAGGLALLAPAEAAEADMNRVQVEASRDGGLVDIRMQVQLDAPQRVIWATLTDYEHTAQWITGMERSVVLERKPDSVIVEQSGHTDIFLWKMAFKVVLDVTEHPPERIDVKLVRGDLRHLEGAYVLRPLAGAADRHELTWQGRIELDSPVPGFLAQPLLVDNVRLRFESLVREIERRVRAERASAP